MKLAIIGSRSFNDWNLADDTFRKFFCDESGFSLAEEIISGGAKGADRQGAELAKAYNVRLTEFIPDWERHGKRAGFLRNEDIVKAADVVLAFWDGVSKGTQNSLSIAKRLKKTTLIVYV